MDLVLYFRRNSAILKSFNWVKTGPFRKFLQPQLARQGKATNIPVIIPLGLHFRTRHFFRTDCWIEYGKPVDLADREFPDDLVNSISSGDWMEPPADLVTELRDEVEKQLAPLLRTGLE